MENNTNWKLGSRRKSRFDRDSGRDRLAAAAAIGGSVPYYSVDPGLHEAEGKAWPPGCGQRSPSAVLPRHAGAPFSRKISPAWLSRSAGGRFTSEDDAARDAAKRHDIVGRFESWLGADDLATGVREWLAEDWHDGGPRCAARGTSWRDGRENRAAAPLHHRVPLERDSRADDLGFRAVLVNEAQRSVTSLRDLVMARDWDEMSLTLRERLKETADPEERHPFVIRWVPPGGGEVAAGDAEEPS